jgi:hypothetical protein
MDIKLLIKETNNIALSLIDSQLFSIKGGLLIEDDNYVVFHDGEKYKLFFIYLNEFINSTFASPLNKKKIVSVLELLIDYCNQFSYNVNFKKFINSASETREFFFKKRFYKYYISPYVVNLEISFAELIGFQANYSKHSFYHLDSLKNKLKNIFKQNGIDNYNNENYNDHLLYFKEAVLDDRLTYNQTHFVIVLGDFFLSFWDLINSSDNQRIKATIKDFIDKNGRLAPWDIEKPKDLTDVEQFYWEIKEIGYYDRLRLEKFIPKKNKDFPIEEVTSKTNMIERHTMDYNYYCNPGQKIEGV